MKVALYARVSTEDQTVENQIPALEAYAKSREWDIAEVYSENESAWRAGHQVELARLLNDLESGRRRYDYLLVWSLDRLTREGIGSLLMLYNHFNKFGCRLISLKESWTEFPNEMTPIFLAMIGFFAKWESDRRSERTKAGLERVRRLGSKSGIGIGKRGKDQGKRRKKVRLIYA